MSGALLSFFRLASCFEIAHFVFCAVHVDAMWMIKSGSISCEVVEVFR